MHNYLVDTSQKLSGFKDFSHTSKHCIWVVETFIESFDDICL